jgi:hypothetical protein
LQEAVGASVESYKLVPGMKEAFDYARVFLFLFQNFSCKRISFVLGDLSLLEKIDAISDEIHLLLRFKIKKRCC